MVGDDDVMRLVAGVGCVVGVCTYVRGYSSIQARGHLQ